LDLSIIIFLLAINIAWSTNHKERQMETHVDEEEQVQAQEQKPEKIAVSRDRKNKHCQPWQQSIQKFKRASSATYQTYEKAKKVHAEKSADLKDKIKNNTTKVRIRKNYSTESFSVVVSNRLAK